jgi:hypothetical protein
MVQEFVGLFSPTSVCPWACSGVLRYLRDAQAYLGILSKNKRTQSA